MACQVDRIIPKYGRASKGSVKMKMVRRTQQWQKLIISGQSDGIMDAMIRQQIREKVLYPLAKKLGIDISQVYSMIPEPQPTVRYIDPASTMPYNNTIH